MKHKDFIEKVANTAGMDKSLADKLSKTTSSIISDILAEGNTVSFQGFGSFIVKKREERLSVIPSTGKRLLIPPKLVPGFKPGSTLKEKIKNLNSNG